MNYSGNMPDWHQYNPSQSGINDVTSTAQNVNSGHLSFISSISPTCPTQLNNLNLNSEGFEKHQSDPNFNPRHFQPHLASNISHGHNATADNTPLASMVQMQNCIGHYGPSNTRNPMVDNSMDPRNAQIGGLNEELGYRNNQVPLNGPISHMNGPNVMNMNVPPHGSIGPRNTNVNSHAANRTAGPPGPPSSYVPCKGLCCNPDPNIGYQQWEKYCSYQNNATYRENIRSSAGYQDARRFNNDFNFRKDNFDGKEVLSPIVPPSNGPNADHRRNFSDFKYRKDRLLSRNYPPSSGMLQNYPMQNYNYTGEYQKYPYNVKEYPKMSGMNVPNQGMVKHQEQGFAIPQQKYNSKQVPYQNNGGTMMPSNIPSATNVPNPSMIPSAQNTYFNSQYQRNIPTENTHDCQETATDNVSMVNRMQASTMHVPPSHPRYQMYQQKIPTAMQRHSIETHLKELSKIPGYQSHPKYKEYFHRYREIMKLQQPITYQGPIQQTPPCATASTVTNTSTIPPINLQFDQNGVLINSNYMPEAFSRIQQVPPVNPQTSLDNLADKQAGKQDSVPEMANHNVQKPERLISQQHNNGDLARAVLCSENVQKQDGYPAQKSLDQRQFEVQKTRSENFNNLGTNAGNTTIRQKMSKEFADKPELDVRQFLANWDESEDEDGASNNLSNAILSESTPVVIVGYENVNLTAKQLEDLNGSKSEEITSNVITFGNQNKNSNIDVVPAQDCLTISYSAAQNLEMAKDSTCKEIISKENIVRPGSHIIQCIRNGPDEVPTIHIVDNLEIGSILQVANGQTVAETLEPQEAVSFFQEGTEVTASAITLEIDKKTDNESASTEYNAEPLGTLGKDIVESSTPPKMVEDTSQTRVNDSEILPISVKDNNLDVAQNMNLKKQSSFASEESHNPDDISLPDLPTSECTPISTTLNTPIHSDNEESSESHVDNLTIPTNPIEVIQNSPMISFTQSPTNREPYDHLSDERNKPVDSSEGEYRAENHFKNDVNKNMLDHDTILGTFEFSNIDKNDSTMTAKNEKERANINKNSKNSNEKASSHDGTENAETASMRMTLTSAGEYELKMSTGTQQSKSMRDYKNSTITEHRANESQVTLSADAHKQLQILPEPKTTLRYANSMELNNTLQNTSDSDPVELGDRNVNYSEKKCISTCQAITTSTISLLPTNDVTPKNSKSAVENDCSTKTVKSNSMSHSTKHSTLSSDKSKKCETFTDDKFAKEDSLLERNVNANKAAKIDAKDSKNSRHVTDHKKSISDNQTTSRKKRFSSENTADKLCSETIVHHNKHTQEAATLKNKSCPVESFKEPDISRNKPKVIDNVNIEDSGERMRLLKEYRRMKYKSSTVGLQNKSKDTQEDSDYTANKKLNSSLNSEEVLQSSSNKELYQKDIARLKSSEEQEKKHASILKTFVTKNINPDFAIQVTNVNLKLKDNDQKESQRLEEETKNSGPLDAIKIEINVSCTERNTTEKLLHENIKNAVAETIGHLTNSISNGVRSNSTNITEIQCDKKTICDKAADCQDYEKRNRSPAALTETSTYTEICEAPTNTEVVKHDAVNTTYKEDSTKDDISGSLKKRRSSLLEGELIDDLYENKGNIDIETESKSSALEISKSEQTVVRRRSLHEESDRKIIAINSCIEELKTSSDNTPCTGSTSRNVSVQKEQQDMTAASLCRNAKNFQDDITSRLNAIPSTSSTIDSSLENVSYNNSIHFDYNHFDVAPNENADTSAKRIDKWKRSKKDDGRFNNFDLYKTASGYVNPTFFSANELENLNTVPVYTTKDGKITYSPNPRFTYRELIMEARANESYDNTRESYFARSPLYDYYNCSKLRKVFKRNRDAASIRKGREGEISSIRHMDHLSNKNVYKSNLCAKTSRNTSHLEFFNDDADKLYTSRSSQYESKENNRKNILDLSFLEKQYNLDNEAASSTKYCKTKALTDNLAYEKGHNESSVLDSSLFLPPKPPCWEETMESIKSYSSHVDRRNSDNAKELNFSEIFAAQKRLDSFPFLSTDQNSSDNSNRKAVCTTINETTHRLTCDYTEDLDSVQNNDSQCIQLDIVPHKEENEYNNQNDASARSINNESANIFNVSLNMQKNDEYAKKQECQSDEIKSSDLFIEQSSPKIIDEKIYEESEKNQCSMNNIKNVETLRSHLKEDNIQVCYTLASPKQDKSNVNENANVKQVSNKSCIEVVNPFELNAESKNILNESKCTDTVKNFALTSNKQDDINDLLKDNSESVVNQEIVHQQDSSTIDHKDSEKVAPAIKSNISTEIDFNQSNRQDNTENSTVCKLNELIIEQNPSDVPIKQSHNEIDNEQQNDQQPENDKQEAEVLSKDQGNDEVDHCSTTITSTPAVALDLSVGENVCDLFANEKHKQNISEFTVIKSIINGDENQSKPQESETKENLDRDCDISLDSKLLCIDSSDCGIYAEDRCPLAQISEHDFTEENSMVPMEWETSQIQEDAVNRLCSIDESAIDFTDAARSLQETNSLLDNLSLSRTSVTKESRVSEAIDEITSKPNEQSDILAIESAPIIEESKSTPTSNDENKEQDQVSSSGYEKMAYLRATDCNANTKIVPKLVIKKSEASSKFVTKMSSSATQMDNTINKSTFRPGCQPKIPKMIIRNARSRPGTPSIEAVHEEAPPVQANISDRVLFTNEELYANESEDSLQDSNNYRNKIPKMKIKLDEKNSNKIVRTEDTEVCVKRKNVKKTVPKVKIKNSSKNDLSDNLVCNNTISQELRDPGRYEEKIPVLKLRKQERNRSPSPEVTRKRQSSCHPEVPSKKYRKSGRDETGHSTRRSNSSDSMRTIAPDHETKKNPFLCISEKIPKVIIKRTSASAEFKCELSKSCKNVIAKSAKWQPEVKLERYRILDSMVKDLKLTLSSPISMRTIDEIFSNRKDGCHRKKKGDYKLSRSNSTSDLLPIKCKQRRMSDYDCRKTNDALSFASSQDTDSRNAKTCTTPKKNRSSKSTDEFQKDNKRSRSHDNNSQEIVTLDVTLSDKEVNRSFEKSSSEKATLQCDEHKSSSFVTDREQVVKADEDTIFSNKLDKKNIPVKQSNDSTDFKLALKELKTTSKIETCFIKVPDLNESLSEEDNLRTNKEQKERDDNVFLDKNDNNKIVIKKERLSSSGDIDNMQDDIGSLKGDPTSLLDNFEMDKNSVIKIESSDESQSTIEILPASPNGTSELENHMIEDGDSEQLYSADAIPTQFELELEITDNSNPDLLDVFMPKLDPITGYCSRRTSNEESCGDQTLKITRCNKFETSFHSKSLLEKDKHVMKIDTSSDDRSVLENNLIGSIKEISSRSSCDKTVASTLTRDNFCCNDSLIKEVLAAKETLKKCLSKSKCESQNNARPKTAAEKKQGSSFDLNSLSETTYSSDASSQGCNDIMSQKNSTSAASNKTENISNAEKSDKKHSKQNKNFFIKKKMKSSEKNDKADTKETIKDTRECTMISLKASKRFDKATSNENLIRTIYLSEKRKKHLTEQSDNVQLQESQRREDKLTSYKIPKISKSLNQENDTNGNTKEMKPKEDNMPILEPEITVNFDANSDRDNSRSPPVITIQDNEDLDISESKLMNDKVITSNDKIEDDTKDVKKSEISVADFITQLAYHEKATIKHRRYCNLCERWFPTTSRHRRHLAGYQHRHIELTQRRSIHTLFMLFTGKSCPRLLPANVARNDCSVGELTPLQIAVQDVTKSFNCTQQSPKKQNDVDK